MLGVEVYEGPAAEAEAKGLEVARVDLETGRFPGRTSSVDVVVCNQVLEHLKNIWLPMTEMHRVLRPGGHAVLSVPNLASLHNRVLLALGRQPTSIRVLGPHVRGYAFSEFRDLVALGGAYEVRARPHRRLLPAAGRLEPPILIALDAAPATRPSSSPARPPPPPPWLAYIEGEVEGGMQTFYGAAYQGRVSAISARRGASVAPGQDRIGHLPVDADLRVVPGEPRPRLPGRRVGEQVDDVGDLAEHDEAVGEADRDVEPAGRSSSSPFPSHSAERRRPPADVNDHVEDGPAGAAHQLRLARARSGSGCRAGCPWREREWLCWTNSTSTPSSAQASRLVGLDHEAALVAVDRRARAGPRPSSFVSAAARGISPSALPYCFS